MPSEVLSDVQSKTNIIVPSVVFLKSTVPKNIPQRIFKWETSLIFFGNQF